MGIIMTRMMMRTKGPIRNSSPLIPSRRHTKALPKESDSSRRNGHPTRVPRNPNEVFPTLPRREIAINLHGSFVIKSVPLPQNNNKRYTTEDVCGNIQVQYFHVSLHNGFGLYAQGHNFINTLMTKMLNINVNCNDAGLPTTP